MSCGSIDILWGDVNDRRPTGPFLLGGGVYVEIDAPVAGTPLPVPVCIRP